MDGTQVATLPADTGLSANPTATSAPSITAYTSVPTQAHTVAYVDPSAFTSKGFLQVSTTLAPLTAGDYYTVVLAGSFCLGTLKFYQFSDTQSTSGRLVLYNVAPDDPQGAVQFGTFPASAGVPLSALGSAQLGARAEGGTSGTNIGAYAGAGGAFRILPSAVMSFDTSNAVPFNALTTFSLFYRDGIPQNATSVHCTDKSATPPFLQGAMTN